MNSMDLEEVLQLIQEAEDNAVKLALSMEVDCPYERERKVGYVHGIRSVKRKLSTKFTMESGGYT